MTSQTRRPIQTALSALAVGLLPAFIVAVSVFADGQWAERRLLILAILAGYVCLGFLMGWLSRTWSAALGLILPALPALVVFGEDIGFALVYFALIAASAAIGTAAGIGARSRRRGTLR